MRTTCNVAHSSWYAVRRVEDGAGQGKFWGNEEAVDFIEASALSPLLHSCLYLPATVVSSGCFLLFLQHDVLQSALPDFSGHQTGQLRRSPGVGEANVWHLLCQVAFGDVGPSTWRQITGTQTPTK